MSHSARRIVAGTIAAFAVCIAWAAQAQMARSPAPDGADLYFITPQDGEEVPPTFTVRFGLSGMGVAPAGIDQANTGHHHLIIDVPDDDIPLDVPLPASEAFVHFGGGQTEAQVTLPPGTHTLKLVLGNFLHIPHDPAVMSDTITITVRE
jgi:hypothetical protein